LIKLSELEQRLMSGCSDKIQLGSFVSAFQVSLPVLRTCVVDQDADLVGGGASKAVPNKTL
jgi:hypothetical protein